MDERVMDEKHLILDRRIRADLEVIGKIQSVLATAELGPETSEKDLVFVGYQLHNLYNAVENIFRNIVGAFGNHLESSTWHAELLDRMRLDLLPLRPAVIDAASFDALDELRRFRHLFRAAYGVELDAERMALVLRKALALRESFPRQIEGFLDFLRRLDSPEESR